ncbi:MAG: hypothetical protein R2755_32950 [Acidimicrobiales bacterium]
MTSVKPILSAVSETSSIRRCARRFHYDVGHFMEAGVRIWVDGSDGSGVWSPSLSLRQRAVAMTASEGAVTADSAVEAVKNEIGTIQLGATTTPTSAATGTSAVAKAGAEADVDGGVGGALGWRPERRSSSASGEQLGSAG